MANNIPEDYKKIVRAFNRNMKAIKRKGYTGARSYQNFLRASETSKYRNLYRTDRNGDLVMRTDFTRLSDAEIDEQMKVMLRTLDAGAYTTRQLEREYEAYFSEHEDVIKKWEKKNHRLYTVNEYMDMRASIDEDSMKRFYYDIKTHSTTQAVEQNVSVEEATNQLLTLALQGKQSPLTGHIYPKAIQQHLDKTYG